MTDERLTVRGADQIGDVILINPAPYPLAKGEIVRIAGVVACRRSAADMFEPRLREFVVVNDVEPDDCEIHIYPRIEVEGAYRTVMASPDDGAHIRPIGTWTSHFTFGS